jgi:hypothetical protein
MKKFEKTNLSNTTVYIPAKNNVSNIYLYENKKIGPYYQNQNGQLLGHTILDTLTPVNNKIYIQIYLKHKKFLDKVLISTKMINEEYDKIKIYNGEIYLQNNHVLNGMKHLNEDIDIFLFFKYLVNLEDSDFLYTYQKELNFSRLDRIMLEWKLHNISNDTSNISLRINNVKKNLDNYPPLNRKYKSLNK